MEPLENYVIWFDLLRSSKVKGHKINWKIIYDFIYMCYYYPFHIATNLHGVFIAQYIALRHKSAIVVHTGMTRLCIKSAITVHAAIIQSSNTGAISRWPSAWDTPDSAMVVHIIIVDLDWSRIVMNAPSSRHQAWGRGRFDGAFSTPHSSRDDMKCVHSWRTESAMKAHSGRPRFLVWKG